MRSPGRRAAPRHRAPSVTARARAGAARLLRGADGAAPGAGEARDADATRLGGDELRGADGEFLGPDGGIPGAHQTAWDHPARDQAAQEQAGREPPERVRPRAKRISPALRRLVMTPTFAAGLGVVVAAFLAANMSRTVLHFSAPIPGNQCSAAGCHAQEPHGGTLASARPGVHITPSAPAPGSVTAIQPGGSQPSVNQPSGSQPGGNQPGGSQPSGGGQGGAAPAAGGSGGPQPSVGSQAFSITYQQVEQWPGGFA